MVEVARWNSHRLPAYLPTLAGRRSQPVLSCLGLYHHQCTRHTGQCPDFLKIDAESSMGPKCYSLMKMQIVSLLFKLLLRLYPATRVLESQQGLAILTCFIVIVIRLSIVIFYINGDSLQCNSRSLGVPMGSDESS